MKKAVETKNAPKGKAPYSQAIMIGDLVFVSGHIGNDPKTNELVKGGIKEQTGQTLKNLENVLKGAGSDRDKVLKVTVYLKNMADYLLMNEIYGKFFKDPYPARATVQVSKLPMDALVEIDCIAYKDFHHDKHHDGGCCGECLPAGRQAEE